jgi:Ca-activated chloride channel family protein
MTFARPLILLFLAVPVVMAFWEWNRRGHPLVMPFDYGHQKKGEWLRRIVNSLNMLPCLLLVIAIVLLAGPQRYGPPEYEKVLTNIQFCLDVSGSMTSGFGGMGSRYDGAMQAIKDFTTYRKGDAFGLTIFGNEVLHWVPVTKDLSAISLATPFLRPEKLPSWYGGTQIGKALRACRKRLNQQVEGDKMIILVSDGASADLFGGEAYNVAYELKEDNIVMYMIHVADGPPQADMYTISSITGGEVFHAGDPQALEAVFRHIDQMQKTRLRLTTPASVDYFGPVSIAGLILTGMQTLVLFGLRYTPW